MAKTEDLEATTVNLLRNEMTTIRKVSVNAFEKKKERGKINKDTW